MSIYISYSSLQDYLTCKKKLDFRLNYEGRSPQTPEMIMGDIVHKAVEDYWNDYDRAIRYITESVRTSIGSKDALTFCINCFDNFQNNFLSILSDTDRSELSFKVPISKDVFVVGRMDRVTSSSIIDWKTSRHPPKSVDDHIQFILYHWAYTKMYGKPPAGVYYAALVSGRLIKYNYNKVKEDLLMKEVIPEMIRDIKTKNYVPDGIFKRACFNCVYNSVCLKELKVYEKETKTNNNLF